MRRTEVVMGIPFTLAVPGEVAPGVFDEVFAELRRLDALLSPFRADSAISRIDSGALDEREAGPLVGEVLALCAIFEAETAGYFTARASGRLDPCGLAKGWAIDRASTMLARAGHRDHLVDGAGDVRVSGERAPGRPWRIGIRHPADRDRVIGVMAGRDLAVATSGTYEKGAHVVDPHTGRGATELLSVTVIGPNIVEADAYATAAFAMGRAGLAFMERIPGYEALAIDRDLRLAATTAFAGTLPC